MSNRLQVRSAIDEECIVMRYLYALTALLASTMASPAYNGSVAGWLIHNIATKDPLTRVGCEMKRDFQNRTKLSIIVSTQYEWTIGVADEAWNRQKGEVVDIAVRVDGKLVANAKATYLNAKLAVLPLSAAGSYRTLEEGQRLELETSKPSHNLTFQLAGAPDAMYAVLDCIKTLLPHPPKAKSGPGQNAQIVSANDVMRMLVTAFQAAGVQNYRLNPSAQQNGQISQSITFDLPGGTSGMLLALRGSGTANADQYARHVIGNLSDVCKGKFLSGMESVPTADGSVARKVVSTCRAANGFTLVAEVNITRRSDGFLTEFTQFSSGDAAKSADDRNRARLVDAVMKLQDGH
jgi:hypothetical protein